MTLYSYLEMKKKECMALARKFRDDKNLNRFWLNAAVGFKKKALNLTVIQGTELIK